MSITDARRTVTCAGDGCATAVTVDGGQFLALCPECYEPDALLHCPVCSRVGIIHRVQRGHCHE